MSFTIPEEPERELEFLLWYDIVLWICLKIQLGISEYIQCRKNAIKVKGIEPARIKNKRCAGQITTEFVTDILLLG